MLQQFVIACVILMMLSPRFNALAQTTGGHAVESWASKSFAAVLNLFSKGSAMSARTHENRYSLSKYPEKIAGARSLIAQERYSAAIDLLLGVLETDAEDFEANALIGACFLAVQKPSFAEGVLYTAVRVSKWTDLVSVANLAEALRLNGDSALAVQVAMRGFETNGKFDPSGHIQYILGNAYRDQAHYSLAADWYLASALAQPQALEAWLKASTMQFPVAGQDFKFADNVLTEALKHLPESATLYFYLGLVAHRSSRYADAIRLYSKALQIDPQHPDALASLATAFHSVGKQNEALQLYQQAYHANAENPILVSNFARLLAEVGRPGEAQSLLRSVSL